MTASRITATARLQRLLALLQWASNHEQGVSVAQLCERFSIKPSELVKELEIASMIGADSPNYHDMPFEVFIEDGLVFVRLMEFQKPMKLSPAEAFALVGAADMLVHSASDTQDVPDSGALRRALDKLAGALGLEPGESVDIDSSLDGGDVARRIRRAIKSNSQIEITYWTYGRDSVGNRLVEPWQLFDQRGYWYLIGFAVDSDAKRIFRLDRIEHLEVLETKRQQTPEIEENPALGQMLDASKVVIELAPSARWVAQTHPVVEIEEAADGWLRATLGVDAAPWLERQLVLLGGDCRLVEIDEEIGSIDLGAQAAKRVLALYERADGAGVSTR